MRSTFPRGFYVPKGALKVRDKASSAVAYLSTDPRRSLPAAVCFSGKRSKPDSNYLYRTEAAREQAVREHFERVRATEANRKARAAACKGAERGLEVGDVLRCSWGYEQTNIDYYEVTALVGKSMVEIREIAQERAEGDFMTGHCVPVPGRYTGEPMRKRAVNGSVRIYSFATAYKVEPTVVAGAKVYDADYWTAYH